MSSGGTLVNFLNPASSLPTHLHAHPHGFGSGGSTSVQNTLQPITRQNPAVSQVPLQLSPGMQNVKMSTSPSSLSSSTTSRASANSSGSSASEVAPTNIISTECYIGMWDNDPMTQPPPTKLETTDIMDLIQQSPGSTSPVPTSASVEAGSTSPTTIIHHTPASIPPPGLSLSVSLSNGSPHSPQTSTSSSSSSSTSSPASTQYLIPLPSLGDPYGTTASDPGCHLLDGFHSPLDIPFPHKLSDTSHAFQEGGYDAFISDVPPPGSHDHHHHSSLLHTPDTGVLLLDMSSGPLAPHHPPPHIGQCSPGCSCQYTSGSSVVPLLSSGDHFPVGRTHPPHYHRHHSDYSWDDLHGVPPPNADYTGLFHRESPTTTDSVMSYNTDNDSKSSSSGGSSLTGEQHHLHLNHHPVSPQPPVKRKVGRPPKKDKKLKRNEKKTGRLWEFIRDLLKNPEYCPSLIKWENHEEGHFRFVNSEKVATLWGQLKNNQRMSYEKLSRAMRYYYKSHVFEPVLGRRLVYKFGHNATNWKPINPNFVNSTLPNHPSHHHLHHHPNHHAHQFQHHQKMYN